MRLAKTPPHRAVIFSSHRNPSEGDTDGYAEMLARQ